MTESSFILEKISQNAGQLDEKKRATFVALSLA